MKTTSAIRHERSVLSVVAIGLSVLSLACTSPAATGEQHVIPIYDEGFAADVFNWSWTVSDPESTEQVYEGSASLYGELNAWEGINLGFRPEFAVPDEAFLEFSVYSEESTDIAIQTSSASVGDGTPVYVSIAAKQWQTESISLDELGVREKLSGIWWQQYSAQPSGGVYLDNIRIATAEGNTDPSIPDESDSPAENLTNPHWTVTIYCHRVHIALSFARHLWSN